MPTKQQQNQCSTYVGNLIVNSWWKMMIRLKKYKYDIVPKKNCIHITCKVSYGKGLPYRGKF